jgi:uncharacterized membrane protein
MLLDHSESFYKWLLLYVLFAMLRARSTYLANQRRPDDDPEKRYYPAILIALAPVTLLLSILVSILVFIMRALLYGLSLAVFTLGLLGGTLVTAVRNTRALYQK